MSHKTLSVRFTADSLHCALGKASRSAQVWASCVSSPRTPNQHATRQLFAAEMLRSAVRFLFADPWSPAVWRSMTRSISLYLYKLSIECRWWLPVAPSLRIGNPSQTNALVIHPTHSKDCVCEQEPVQPRSQLLLMRGASYRRLLSSVVSVCHDAQSISLIVGMSLWLQIVLNRPKEPHVLVAE